MANKGSTEPLGATDTGLRPGAFPLGSALSRAAARSVLAARKNRETEEEWDKDFDLTGLAEHLAAARERNEDSVAHSVDWSPIHIPPGKEGTVRRRLAARINAADVRLARFRAEEKAER